MYIYLKKKTIKKKQLIKKSHVQKMFVICIVFQILKENLFQVSNLKVLCLIIDNFYI